MHYYCQSSRIYGLCKSLKCMSNRWNDFFESQLFFFFANWMSMYANIICSEKYIFRCVLKTRLVNTSCQMSNQIGIIYSNPKFPTPRPLRVGFITLRVNKYSKYKIIPYKWSREGVPKLWNGHVVSLDHRDPYNKKNIYIQ